MGFRCHNNTCLQQLEISLSLNNSFNNKEMLMALSLLVPELEWNPWLIVWIMEHLQTTQVIFVDNLQLLIKIECRIWSSAQNQIQETSITGHNNLYQWAMFRVAVITLELFKTSIIITSNLKIWILMDNKMKKVTKIENPFFLLELVKTCSSSTTLRICLITQTDLNFKESSRHANQIYTDKTTTVKIQEWINIPSNR